MENLNQTIEPVQPQISDAEMLQEIYKNSIKTKNYMKWQLIITVALVVIPLLATVVIIPFALKSLSSAYGLSTDLTGAGANIDAQSQTLQELLK